MSRLRLPFAALPLVLGLLACGTTEEGGSPGPAAHGCAADTYVDATEADASRSVDVGAVALGAFTPACLKVKAGQTVTFEGNFVSHPLSPADPIEGNPENPITVTTSGTSAEFTFAAAGTFTYFCEIHGSPAGEGMAGVIYVVP